MKKFDILYVDPPWAYRNKRTGGSHTSGAAQKYQTIDIVNLENLYPDLEQIMNKDSCVFLWTTNSFIREALFVLENWNYEYKTMLTWNKMRYGMGYWFRGQTEHVLFGTKGKFKPFKSSHRNIFTESNQGYQHSEKPTEMRKIITDISNTFNYRVLELFATHKQFDSNMWLSIGDKISNNTIEVDLKILVEQIQESGNK